MNKAIIIAEQAQKERTKAGEQLKLDNTIQWEIEQRKADQHYGEAVGINQVLVVLNFTHDKMKVLSSLI